MHLNQSTIEGSPLSTKSENVIKMDMSMASVKSVQLLVITDVPIRVSSITYQQKLFQLKFYQIYLSNPTVDTQMMNYMKI